MNLAGKNLIRLCFGQFCAYIHGPALIFSIPIIGFKLAPNPSLATAPIALLTLAIVGSIPIINRLMKIYGRRLGYMLGSFITILSSLGCFLSLYYHSFLGLCLAVMMSGISGAFVHNYRFAVLEFSPKEKAGLNVSLLLLGGVAGGFSGPLLVNLFADSLKNQPFAASFLALALVGLISLVVLSGLKFQDNANDTKIDNQNQTSKPFQVNQYFLACAICGASAYGLMSLLMTATPVVMHHHHHYSLTNTAFVIQSHVVAMFLPSLFTGILIDKFGVRLIMYLGALILLFCSITALLGVLLTHFWLALVLLGVGWNFLFVGSTIAVSRTYGHHQRFQAQSKNDVIVFSVQALGVLSSAWLLNSIGWNLMHFLAIAILGLITPLIYFSKMKKSNKLVVANSEL